MAHKVVVLEGDPKLTQSLVGGLQAHFHPVQLAASDEELRRQVAQHKPEAVIVDIESWKLADVASLHRDFPALPIVCTHRIPDEEIWMAALNAGASDVCPVDDVKNVLTSVLRSVALRVAAAA
jgi:DNA-binding response OmpR family regulator